MRTWCIAWFTVGYSILPYLTVVPDVLERTGVLLEPISVVVKGLAQVDAIQRHLGERRAAVGEDQGLQAHAAALPFRDADDRTDVQAQLGQVKFAPVGSTAVRGFLERHQPLLGLHGHIHESRGITRLGRSVVINPGSAYSTGALYGAGASLLSALFVLLAVRVSAGTALRNAIAAPTKSRR